jgi:hypothetical protein
MPDRAKPSAVPSIPLRRIDDLIDRISDLKTDADSRGYGTLAYFLQIALNEAKIQKDRQGHDEHANQVEPHELWRPET